MPKLVWIENALLFKVKKSFRTQDLCICCNSYKQELGLEIGDVIFVKDEIKPNIFKRLGQIKAFDTPNKVIIEIMTDIGVGTKTKIKTSHYNSIEGKEDIEQDNDGTLY